MQVKLRLIYPPISKTDKDSVLRGITGFSRFGVEIDAMQISTSGLWGVKNRTRIKDALKKKTDIKLRPTPKDFSFLGLIFNPKIMALGITTQKILTPDSNNEGRMKERAGIGLEGEFGLLSLAAFDGINKPVVRACALANVARHEAGHILGAKHCQDENCVMGTESELGKELDFCRSCNGDIQRTISIFEYNSRY